MCGCSTELIQLNLRLLGGLEHLLADEPYLKTATYNHNRAERGRATSLSQSTFASGRTVASNGPRRRLPRASRTRHKGSRGRVPSAGIEQLVELMPLTNGWGSDPEVLKPTVGG